MQVAIEKLVYGGAGLARTEAGVVFVPKVAPGDVVEIDIIRQKKDYSLGILRDLVKPSPDRKTPVCPNYETVGCCHWDHIRYERQIDYKKTILRESLSRLAKLAYAEDIRTISGPEHGYRLRASFHLQNGALGFVRENSNTVVPIRECAALTPELNKFIPLATSFKLPASTADVTSSGSAMAATFRFDEEVRNQPWERWRDAMFEIPGVAAVTFLADSRRIHYHKEKPLIEVGGNRYELSSDSFFQANRFLLAGFVSQVLDEVGSTPGNILELFSGAGFFSIPAARVCQSLIGVESSRLAVKQARENAKLNRLGNVEFAAGTVETILAGAGADLRPDVVVVNPPRTGAGSRVAALIAGLKARRIVYVSCNPTTLAPDAAVLSNNGYRLKRLTLIDQFPNTYHIEMVARFDLE